MNLLKLAKLFLRISCLLFKEDLSANTVHGEFSVSEEFGKLEELTMLY